MNTKSHFRIARIIATLLDSQFSFLGIKFGIDPIMGIIPGVGSLFPACLSLYIVWIGYQHKIPQSDVARMILYIIIDFIIGSIPVLGVVADVFIRANEKNLQILEKHVAPEEVQMLHVKE